MDDMMNSAGTLINGANDMIKNINAILGDAKTQAAMRGSIQNVEAITGQTSAMMEANAANIQQITANMAAMTAQMNASLQQLDGDGATSATSGENGRQYEKYYGTLRYDCPLYGNDDDQSAEPGRHSDDAAQYG